MASRRNFLWDQGRASPRFSRARSAIELIENGQPYFSWIFISHVGMCVQVVWLCVRGRLSVESASRLWHLIPRVNAGVRHVDVGVVGKWDVRERVDIVCHRGGAGRRGQGEDKVSFVRQRRREASFLRPV